MKTHDKACGFINDKIITSENLHICVKHAG